MKFIRVLVAGIVAAGLSACSLTQAGMVDLDTVPYSFHPPAGLETKLSVEPMTGDWAEEAFAAGVESAVFVTYTPDEGDPTSFMGVYYMPEAIFDAVNLFLEEKNLLVKEGTSLDATLIAAPTSTKNKDKSRDPEMSSTKKNNQWYFGMKAHIGVQSRGKPLVHSIVATTAKEHDSVKTYDLLHGEEEAVFGDKAYDDQALKQSCRQQGIFYGITNKAKSNQHVPSTNSRNWVGS